MVSVLFVDDDATGLAALKQAYGRCRGDWDMAFLSSTDAALDTLAGGGVDAVVTSARLSDMSAARFLRLVKDAHPATARLALAGPGDRSAAQSTLPVAGECLSKACGPEVLAGAVERATRLSARLYSSATLDLVRDLGSLPSLPDNVQALDTALGDEECSLAHIADIVSTDVAMTAKILALVNSSFFGLRTEVSNLRNAVAYLGVEALRDFALAGAVFRAFTPGRGLPTNWLGDFQHHGSAVGEACSSLVRNNVARCEASVAGMLHGLGELVLADRAPDQLRAIAAEVAQGAGADEVELGQLGTTLPVVAGHLLSAWGMGSQVIEAVAYQREREAGGARNPELTDLLAAAEAMCGPEPGSDAQDNPGDVPVCLSASCAPDAEYLAALGLGSVLVGLHSPAKVPSPAG